MPKNYYKSKLSMHLNMHGRYRCSPSAGADDIFAGFNL